MRTLSEILKEADEKTTIKELSVLSDYLFENRAKYKRSEVSFGIEHIKEKAEIIKQQNDIGKLFE